MINECFLKYKDLHKNETAIFFGTGPSLNEYENNINGVKFGCNEMIYSDIKLDYYFLGDPGDKERGYLNNPDDYKNYKSNKFFRTGQGNHKGIPEGCENAQYYNITDWSNKCEFGIDLTEKMGANGTISLEVMQFILYTGCNKIYLIGHDCDYVNGTFKSPKAMVKAGYMIAAWNKLKKWIDDNFEVNIFIVRPKGLTIFPEYKIG